ncbi:hypothetical protein GW17_00030377, partial [Ensete ventricosum]
TLLCVALGWDYDRRAVCCSGREEGAAVVGDNDRDDALTVLDKVRTKDDSAGSAGKGGGDLLCG